MAVDVCFEIASLNVSPRISFSHDDGIPIECHNHYRSDAFLLESTIDFDFCVTDMALISSADELFSNGKILPVEVRKSTPFKKTNQSEPKSVQKLPKTPVLENGYDTKKKSLKEFLSTDLDDDEQETDKLPQPKPFWQFRRSSSLNYPNNQNNGFLQFLTRSNSTGSAPIQKNPKIYHKQNSQKEQIKVLRKSSSVSSSSTSSSSSSSSTNFWYLNLSHPLHSSSKRGQTHPLKKSYSRSYSNGVHVSPVLNIPHGYITKDVLDSSSSGYEIIFVKKHFTLQCETSQCKFGFNRTSIRISDTK
ncbi:hypothetical protein K7X08_006737 [Anisodus acutangulus]|uniref:Uncharacterized protein n=1 Tax=Anisodus acutangulus TaxID=402998 RepID=A0A9Q1MWJ7_9SOLA|nr:hypothetical protein K7X08_006737 [Anisodus acutangulus]